MADELIRLDTTIIGIDAVINKAETAAEANALFKAKDVIYSQRRYFADVQPTKKVDEYRSLLEECERKLCYLLECEIENSTSVIEVKSLINKIQSSLKGSEQNV